MAHRRLSDEERESSRKATYKRWYDKNKAYFKSYSKKRYLKNKVKDMKSKLNAENQQKAEDFIKIIESQRGRCTEMQAFQLMNLYSDLLGSEFYRKYDDIEDELSYMYLSIKKLIELPIEIEPRHAPNSKVCSTCGVNKPISDFTIDRKTKDGYSLKCRDCKNEYYNQWHLNNPGKKQQYYKKRPVNE